jgi:outer membrane protein assembly factor BamA
MIYSRLETLNSRIVKLIATGFILLLSGPVLAATDTVSVKPVAIKKDSTRQTDLMDVFHRLFGLGISNSKNNTVGLKPVATVVPAFGYAMQSRLAVSVSGNVAFRTDSRSHISLVNFCTSYSQNGQFTLPLSWNIWNADNRYNFIGEMRFYRYPQSTYGLGSKSFIGFQNPMNYNYLHLSESVLRRVTGDFYLGAGYVMDNHWNVSQSGPANNTFINFETYGAASHTVSSGLTLSSIYDNRDCAINPAKGFYVQGQYRQNLTTFGSASAWSSLMVDVRKYFRFPANSGNVLAFWSYSALTLGGKPPYLDLPATLWDANTNTGRGYIQGRFRGAQMLYGEAEYRFGITGNGLVGGVVFANGQSLSGAPGTRLQAIQPAYGPGVRIKLNKVSRTNIALDYGIGREGSKGIFVNVGEIF